LASATAKDKSRKSLAVHFSELTKENTNSLALATAKDKSRKSLAVHFSELTRENIN
jgi:hypothetical protein